MKKHQTKVGLHPVMFFLVLCLITIVLSGVLRVFNVQATFNKVSSVTGEFQITSEAVNSLFSLRGLKYIFTTTVSSFANFAVLSNLIIVLLGIGIMDKSGFLKTVVTLLTKKAKKTTVTYLLVLICILSSIIGDLSYIIFIPLSALLFLYGKRNPIIGIITSYAALSCGSALSLFLTSVDSSLVTMTIRATYLFGDNYFIPQFGYLFIMIVLIVALSLIITNISENYVAKKVPKYEFPEDDVEEELLLTKKKMRGLVMALGAGIIYLIIFIYNIIPGLPLSGALLDYRQELYIDKLFSYNSFFSNGFVFIIAVLFIILGLCYGIGAKTIKNNKEFVEGLGHSLNGIGKVIVMIFAAAAFINIFKQSNIGAYIAATFTNMISNSNFASFALIILLFVCSMLTSLFLPNVLNSWNIMSGCVPALMEVGISPAFSQLVFRLGAAVTVGLTPVFAYFIVYFAYLENYNQGNKSITYKDAFKYQLPYSIAALVLYLVIIILWFIVDIPLGLGGNAVAL